MLTHLRIRRQIMEPFCNKKIFLKCRLSGHSCSHGRGRGRSRGRGRGAAPALAAAVASPKPRRNLVEASPKPFFDVFSVYFGLFLALFGLFGLILAYFGCRANEFNQTLTPK